MTNLTHQSRKPNSELFDAAQRRLGSAEYRPIESLTANSPTPRRHPERQLAKLTASMKRFGFVMPALADGNGTIIAGHARIEAARRAGLTEVPVLVACGWTEAQIGSYRHADSRLTELATWDEQLLTIELSALLGVDGLLNSLGCEPSEIDLILSEAAIGDGNNQPTNAASKLSPVVVSLLRRSWPFEVYRLALSTGKCRSPLEYLPATPNFFIVCVDLAHRHWASIIGAESALAETAAR